ncbi:MerR family transcriptional regulator [Kutzneria sp. NPDC052558]|uniref:MerR family transcriptional regulator n=1 Tax=Kutzneria sp. NPDC052558 TaxID=3364121 RepID=UPI0037C93B5F
MDSLRISQLAERVGVRPTTLRFYEQAGLLPARRSESGYRLYGEDAVERLGFIGAGKRLGLPLEEIRELLRVWEEGLCVDVRASLRPMVLARIADAEQRAAESAAFTGRLRAALAEIDGPPRPGRCEPGCGYLGDRDDVTPIACTLTGGDRAERLERWRRVLSNAHGREVIAGGLRIQLPATLASEVAELAAAEQRCCAFFDMSLHFVDGQLRLEVRAPAEAAPLVAEVFGRPVFQAEGMRGVVM